MTSLGEIEERLRRLNEQLKANRRLPGHVGMYPEPGFDHGKYHPSPAWSAEAEKLVTEIVAHYPTADEPWRVAVRGLVRKHQVYGWGVHPPFDTERLSIEQLWDGLVMFSLVDLGNDPREFVPILHQLMIFAREADLDLGPLLPKVAALSSAEGMSGLTTLGGWTTRGALEGVMGPDGYDMAALDAAQKLVDARGDLVEEFNAAHARFRRRGICRELTPDRTRKMLQTTVDVVQAVKRFQLSYAGQPQPSQARREEIRQELEEVLERECAHAPMRLKAAGLEILEG